MTTDKLLWNVKEVCFQLGIGRTTLMAMTHKGIVPSLLIGRRRMYSAQAVREWIDSKKATKTEGGQR